jgi:hypothetical protein
VDIFEDAGYKNIILIGIKNDGTFRCVSNLESDDYEKQILFLALKHHQ